MFDSPKKYILTRARSLPIHQCYITANWHDSGIATIVVARRHTNGHFTIGTYLVDLYCFGVKDTGYYFNTGKDELDEILERFQSNGLAMNPCDYAVAHNVIYGAIEFAEEYGFKPHKEFAVTKFILEEDDERVELIEYEFGMDGKPCVFADAEHPQKAVIAQLEKTAGKGNFEVIYVDELEDDDDEDDDDDDELDELDEEEEYEEYEEDEYDEYDEDDEFDFANWTEQQWQDYIDRKKEVPEKYVPVMVDAIFGIVTAKDNMPDSIYLAGEFLDKFTIVDEPVDIGYKAGADEKRDMEELIAAMEGGDEKDAPKHIAMLNERLAKFPHNPLYYDLLGNATYFSGNKEAALEIKREMMRRFPDCYLAKLKCCTFHILMKTSDEIPAVLNNAVDLEHLPDKEKFTVYEMMLYCSVLCQYHLHKDNLRLADVYYNAAKMLHREYDVEPFDNFIEQTFLQVVTRKAKYLENMKSENASAG